MAETFEAYRTRVLSYLGDEEPTGVQQATPSQLESRLRDVAPEELIRRPAPEKWSIAEIVAHLADAEAGDGVAIAKHAGESGRGLDVVGSGRMGRAFGLRAARGEPFGRGLSSAAREQPATFGGGPARTVVECYGVHEVRGRQTVEEFVRLEAAHDLNHLRQIDQILNSRRG